jgi:hypothetical protein
MAGLFSDNPFAPQFPSDPQGFTPEKLARLLPHLTPEQLRSLPHDLLYSARMHVPKEQQGLLSPYEHRAYTKEAVYDNPLMALPLAFATPAYQGYKYFAGSRSAPAMKQVTEAYGGIKDGLLKRLREIEMKVMFTDPFGDSTR